MSEPFVGVSCDVRVPRGRPEAWELLPRVAPGFRPVAFAPDALIEAIENDDETILAVQWHPERTLRSPASRKLFRAFARLCARRPIGAAEAP